MPCNSRIFAVPFVDNFLLNKSGRKSVNSVFVMRFFKPWKKSLIDYVSLFVQYAMIKKQKSRLSGIFTERIFYKIHLGLFGKKP